MAGSCERSSERLGPVADFSAHGNEGEGPVAVSSEHDNEDSASLKAECFLTRHYFFTALYCYGYGFLKDF